MLELPLSALKVSAVNVRADTAMDENLKSLIASIRSVGLLQPLVVTGDSKTGFEIVAGRRRFAALQALDAEGHAFATVPCVVVDAATAAEASLAENYAREQMKPIALYRAFARVRDSHPDYTDQDLARAFDLELDVVRRTLRLGRIHPDVIAMVEDGTLRTSNQMDMLQAFAATEDTELQKQVAESLAGSGYVYPETIRKALGVAAGDFKLKVVGVEAYTEAGGRFERDLFNTHDATAGRVLDPEILDRLANEKLCGLLAELVGGDESIKLSYEAPRHQYGGADESLRIRGEVILTEEQEKRGNEIQVRLGELNDMFYGEADFPAPEEGEDEDAVEQRLSDEINALEDEWEKLNEGAVRTYPAGRKIAVPSFERHYVGDDRVEELTFHIYWADKQAKKDADAAAKALAKAESGEAPVEEKQPEKNKDLLTGKATDALAAIRKDMLKKACAETADADAPWRFIYVNANAAAIRYGANQGFKHIHTGDYIPLNELAVFKKETSFADFMALPEEKRLAIAALLLSSFIDNHPIVWKEPTFAIHHFGAKAQAEARRYWEPTAEFFDMFKKQILLDMIGEVSPALASMYVNAKVREVKDLALDLFTEQKKDYKLLGIEADTLEAAKAFVPKWLRLAPPEPKQPKAAKAKKGGGKKKEAANCEERELEDAA